MNTILTSEEFKRFHTIDRELYCRLTFSLHHDPLLSIRIMTFWLWLEYSKKLRNFISYLHSLPPHLLNSLILETITCLYCLDNSSSFSLSLIVVGMPYLQLVLNNNNFSLSYLINNQAKVLESMRKISYNVCVRAFDDILSQLLLQRQQAREWTIEQDHMNMSDARDDFMRPVVVGPRRNNITRRRDTSEIRSEEQYHDINNSLVYEQISRSSVNVVENQLPLPVKHVDSGLRSSTKLEKTIFLTFSPGSYHVTENQLREFFIRQYGEIIEDLIMPDLSRKEQPLYGRIIVHTSNEVETVLGGQKRIKFTINGKHVYAHGTYVKKNQASTLVIPPTLSADISC